MRIPLITQSLLTSFAFSAEGRPIQSDVPVLSEELLATFQAEDGKGKECPSVLVYDVGRMIHIECRVWIYPKGVYNHAEDSFIFTDKTSDTVTHDRLMVEREKTGAHVDYGEYIRHMRYGIGRGVGKAILTRSEVIEALRTKRYTVS